MLTSPDLLPPLLSSLEACHWAAANVCGAWQQAWLATADQRRWLRRLTQAEVDTGTGQWAASAGGEVVCTVELRPGLSRRLHVYDGDLHATHMLVSDDLSSVARAALGHLVELAVTPTYLYFAGCVPAGTPEDLAMVPAMHRLQLSDGAVLAEHRHADITDFTDFTDFAFADFAVVHVVVREVREVLAELGLTNTFLVAAVAACAADWLRVEKLAARHLGLILRDVQRRGYWLGYWLEGSLLLIRERWHLHLGP